MLFELDRHSTKIAAREMAPQSLAQKQRDIYDSHRHRVYSVSYYMTGSELEAEEILRGAFIRAFLQEDEPDHAISDAALLEQLRDQRVLLDETPMPLPAADCQALRNNVLRTELEEAIRFLPSRERLVFLLMDVEGYPAARVAELLNVSPSSVIRTAFAARMRVRAELAAMGDAGQQAA